MFEQIVDIAIYGISDNLANPFLESGVISDVGVFFRQDRPVNCDRKSQYRLLPQLRLVLRALLKYQSLYPKDVYDAENSQDLGNVAHCHIEKQGGFSHLENDIDNTGV
jgi:hypothetical protein